MDQRIWSLLFWYLCDNQQINSRVCFRYSCVNQRIRIVYPFFYRLLCVLNFLLPQLVFEAYYSGIYARINRLIVGFASGIRVRINGSKSFILSFYQLLFGEYSAASKTQITHVAMLLGALAVWSLAVLHRKFAQTDQSTCSGILTIHLTLQT